MVIDVEVETVEGIRILRNPREDPRVCCPPATSVNPHQADNHQGLDALKEPSRASWPCLQILIL